MHKRSKGHIREVKLVLMIVYFSIGEFVI